MADCTVDVVLINPLENPVKFCNSFSCLSDLTPLAFHVLFCFIKPLFLYQFHKSSDVLIEHGSYGKYPVENDFPQDFFSDEVCRTISCIAFISCTAVVVL